ncbi:hypothetical protein Nepgr_027840 [Nepenthes gracilis]|uniref:Uncharacterized protein n=1 Tax=Nepenthes gracilis TaxID=150966 RepID=A0AAD3TCG4_NEPGR|nr:hypothetical protein Nepgr_027840 [Nepenthes gracilis]
MSNPLVDPNDVDVFSPFRSLCDLLDQLLASSSSLAEAMRQLFQNFYPAMAKPQITKVDVSATLDDASCTGSACLAGAIALEGMDACEGVSSWPELNESYGRPELLEVHSEKVESRLWVPQLGLLELVDDSSKVGMLR